MTTLRWARRALDLLLVAAVLVVVVTAGITLLAPVLGGRALVIGGGSMEPTIPRGALVLARPAGEGAYAVGDVVTIQQGASTPYTHRITRLAELKGVPYVETKGDSNAQPDPAIVPRAAVVGRIVVSLPLLGYLSVVLGTAAGLAGFLALCATLLLLIWVLEDLEEERCPACAALPAGGPAHGDARIGVPAPATSGATAATASAVLSALPAFALPAPRAHVREGARARDPRTPVLLEADRRNPRHRGIATLPEAPAEPAVSSAISDDGRLGGVAA
jgi:signal peptidase